MTNYDGHPINESYSYWNDDGNPRLYDRKLDIFYPLIKRTNDMMIFDGFIRGCELMLKVGGKGLELDNIYVQVTRWEAI